MRVSVRFATETLNGITKLKALFEDDPILVDSGIPARLCAELSIKCLCPVRERSNADFWAIVNEELSKAIQIIYE
ncbi:hypothetical protein IEC97_14640 [Neobacillus cucumis]|uniref:hypothetical protein n=1 Tax=Neobacillus cucumis TaxID=1740721 RepID=UPI0018E0010A|nr:hypothetical protein [Neobacillus cucumis]MBI0578601.1 hypothetical protein [Neobacillus cucumis]